MWTCSAGPDPYSPDDTLPLATSLLCTLNVDMLKLIQLGLTHNGASPPLYSLALLCRFNVDMLKLIQLGLTPVHPLIRSPSPLHSCAG